MDYNDLPQLIVALDADDEKSNYVHINDAKDINYYCPCCKGIVKPRAYRNDKVYQVQSHFYHVNGACDSESRVHWMYKNWLLHDGAKFYVGTELFTVLSIEIEKQYNTSFGIYKPDITVNTDKGIIFFEINFSNKKGKSDYFCKWQELDINVVEVNVKELLLQNYNKSIPIFSYIFYDGKCLREDYVKKDTYASTIGKRKIEWKRQDKINYKIMWEKLDWFWRDICDYKAGIKTTEDICSSFSKLDYLSMIVCRNITRKLSCQKEIRENIDNICYVTMRKYINDLNSSYKSQLSEDININYLCMSERVAYVICSLKCSDNPEVNYCNEIRISKNKGLIVQEQLDEIESFIQDCKKILDTRKDLLVLENKINSKIHNANITIQSLYNGKAYSNITFYITDLNNISSEYTRIFNFKPDESDIENKIIDYINRAYKRIFAECNCEIISEKLLSDSRLMCAINECNSKWEADDIPCKIRIDDEKCTIIVEIINHKCDYNFVVKDYPVLFFDDVEINEIISDIENNIDSNVRKVVSMFDVIFKYDNYINHSSSGIWSLKKYIYHEKLFLDISINTDIKKYDGKRIRISNTDFEDYDLNGFEIWLKAELERNMNRLIDDANKGLKHHGQKIIYITGGERHETI